MATIAAYNSTKRGSYKYKRVFYHTFIAIFTGSLLTMFMVIVVIIEVDPWYNPQYLIPLTGMVLGNSLNGISLGFDRYLSELKNRQGEIEELLTLGATTWEANREIFRNSVRAGSIPIINQMMVVGLVTLPGLMTGQILSGIDPFEAVKYQILIMFMIANTNSVSLVIFLFFAYKKVFDKNKRLKSEIIEKI